MRDYVNFDVCTQQALEYTLVALDVELSDEEQAKLLDEYLNLKVYPDVVPGICALREAGHPVVAFSNGVEATLRELLGRAGVLEHLSGIVSVDDIETFKPNPDVYTYLANRLDRPLDETWLVSSNYWDIVGARTTGLRAAWVQRNPDVIPDVWGIGPDLVVSNLEELAERF